MDANLTMKRMSAELGILLENSTWTFLFIGLSYMDKLPLLTTIIILVTCMQCMGLRSFKAHPFPSLLHLLLLSNEVRTLNERNV